MRKTVCVWLAVLLLLTACAQTATATWQEQYDLGVRYLSEGKYEEAILAFNAAIEIDPRQADAYIGLADAYVTMGDVEMARRVLEDALAVVGDPETIRSRLDSLGGGAATEPTPGPTPESTPEPAPTDQPDEETGPTYLLTRQAGYTPDGILVLECLFQYDAQGYILSYEYIVYNPYDGSSKSDITTYEYTGEYEYGQARCRIIYDRRNFESEEEWLAAQYESSMSPGPIGVRWTNASGSVDYHIVTEPLIGEPPELISEVISNDGIMVVGPGYYLVYTFDEAGNPISSVTYNDAGAVTGTSTFEWQLLE